MVGSSRGRSAPFESALPCSPHIPTDPIGGSTPPPAARAPLSIFRKIHLYGKNKKSTHGHTTTTPALHGERTSSSFGAQTQMQPIGIEESCSSLPWGEIFAGEFAGAG